MRIHRVAAFRASIAAAFLLSLTTAGAQTTIAQGSAVTFGGSSHANLVKDGAGRLFALLLDDQPNGDRTLEVQISFDGGATWQRLPVTLNDAASGLVAPNLTNNAAFAIDDRGVLHVTWAGHFYPSYYAQYYRSYDPIAGTTSPIVDISAMQGAAVTARTAAMAIAVDAGNTVWLVAQSPSSWVENLLRSNQPYAVGGSFTSIGSISPTASSQTSRIAIDTAGRVHCAYYRNVAPGIYEHRFYDPQTGWGLETLLGNSTAPNDYYGVLTSDALGNVHAAYVKDSVAGATWDFAYRRWDATNGWGSEVPLFQATSAQYTGIASYRIFALACNEASGRVSALYRDLSTDGRLRMVTKDLAANAFQLAADLRPADLALSAYHEPVIRGTLYPAFQRTGSTVDFAWREGTTTSALYFQRLPECNGTIARIGTGCSDGSGRRAVLAFEGAPCLGGAMAVGLRGHVVPSFLVIGLSSSFWNGIPLPLDLGLFGAAPGCTLLTSQEVLLGPIGAGVLPILPVPNQPLLIGRTGYFQSFLIDPTLSTALPLATSDALAATFRR